MLYLFFLAGLFLAVGCLFLLHWTGLTILWGGLLLWLACTLALLLLFCLAVWLLTLTIHFNQPPKENHKGFRRLAIFIMHILLNLLRVHVEISGTEQIPLRERFLLVGNHRSNIDPIVTVWALRKWDLSFVTKPGVMKIPIAGKIIFKCGFLPLDRDDNRAALKTILAAVSYLKEDQFSIGIYPEGTRNRTQELLPFRNGAFKIAQKANVPIVVVKLENTERLSKNYPWRATKIHLRVCEVLSREFVAAHNTNEIGEEVRRILST